MATPSILGKKVSVNIATFITLSSETVLSFYGFVAFLSKWFQIPVQRENESQP